MANLKGTKKKDTELELSNITRNGVRSKSFKTNREIGY